MSRLLLLQLRYKKPGGIMQLIGVFELNKITNKNNEKNTKLKTWQRKYKNDSSYEIADLNEMHRKI